MPVRGFVLSIDGLFALAIATAAIALVASSPPAFDDSAYYRIASARDFLDVKYSVNSSLSPSDFQNATGLEVTEVQPSSGEWLGADKAVYGPVGGCTNSSNCLFSSASQQATVLSSQDFGSGIFKRAWVRLG